MGPVPPQRFLQEEAGGPESTVGNVVKAERLEDEGGAISQGTQAASRSSKRQVTVSSEATRSNVASLAA